MSKTRITYATTSPFKRQEFLVIQAQCTFRNEDGADQLIGDRFDFQFSDVKTDEPLEVRLDAMVRHKAVSAYRTLLVPCIVEHAGIILVKHRGKDYPGGLTQPMMDALGAEQFVHRLSAAGERAIARAVIGYCDGMSVEVFSGETEGTIVSHPKGGREFYWDTIFAPDGYKGRTYAEIAEDPSQGIAEKMKVSQSARAVRMLAEWRVRKGASSLFSDFGS